MRVLVEHKPDEIVTDAERCGRLAGMLRTGLLSAPLGDIGDRHVYTLDGKAFIVGPETVEIWNYFVLMDASRNGVVDLKRY